MFTNSFCTYGIKETLKIQGASTSYSLSTLNGSDIKKHTSVVNLNLKSMDGRETLRLTNVYVVVCIPVKVPEVDVRLYPHLQGLSFVSDGAKIDLLIGQDPPEALMRLA